MIAFGMIFVMLTGGIDLSVGSTLALSSTLMASLLGVGFPPLLTIVVGHVIGAMLGAVNGLMVTKGKMASFIATLATMTIFRGVNMVFTGGNPITGLSDSVMFQLLCSAVPAFLEEGDGLSSC